MKNIFRSILLFVSISAIFAPKPYERVEDDDEFSGAIDEADEMERESADRVCVQDQNVLDRLKEMIKISAGDMRNEITLWALQNNLVNLPRQIHESAYVSLKIAMLETRMFSSMPQLAPLNTYGAFPPIVNARYEIVSEGSDKSLIGNDGAINPHGKAVIATTFHRFSGAKPLIASELLESAKLLISKINLYFADRRKHVGINWQNLVDSYERTVYGNLSAELRLNRLTKFFGHSGLRYNPVPLLIEYMKWPEFPLERPADIDSEWSASIPDLNPSAANQMQHDYDPSAVTDFDLLIIDGVKRDKRFKLRHRLFVAGESVCFSLTAVAVVGAFNPDIGALGVVLAGALALAGYTGEEVRQVYVSKYKTAIDSTPAEKYVLEKNAAENLLTDMVDVIPV